MTRFVRTRNTLATLLILAAGAGAADTRLPAVQHEMVPHVVLPETIQYHKTTKRPADGDFGSVSPSVATYTPFPSYQVPYTAEFKSMGQNVYPVSPAIELNVENGKSEPEEHTSIPQLLTRSSQPAADSEPILLAADSEELVPLLPPPDNDIIELTGVVCQQPAKLPTAWSFTSPIFKIASVPAGSYTGNNQAFISSNGLHGNNQQIGIQPANSAGQSQPANNNENTVNQIPYSTFSFGIGRDNAQPQTPQVYTLPNGMILVSIPVEKGRFFKRSGTPRTIILPPASAFGHPAEQTAPAQVPAPHGTMMLNSPQTAPQIVMTPQGLAIVNYQSAISPATPSISASLLSSGMMQTGILQTSASESKAEVTSTPVDTAAKIVPQPQVTGLAVTPYGLVTMVPQAGQVPLPLGIQNPYQGYYATPYGLVPNLPMGFAPQAAPNMSAADLIAALAQVQQNNTRKSIADRLAERRKNRSGNDTLTQLCEAWATPYAAPGMTMQMPARNAYPYGYFGVQAQPVGTANYGGYYNTHYGTTTFPGAY